MPIPYPKQKIINLAKLLQKLPPVKKHLQRSLLIVTERDENVQLTIDWVQIALIRKFENIFLLKKIANKF